MTEPHIVTERLVLREYIAADLDALAEHFADQDVMAFYPGTKDRAGAAAWIEKNQESYRQHGFGHWVVNLTGDPTWIGNVGFWVQDVDGYREIELGWHVARRHWRRGIATEAARACISYGAERLGLTRIVSMIRPENVPSIGVATKIGMRLERSLMWKGFRHGVYVLDDVSRAPGKIPG